MALLHEEEDDHNYKDKKKEQGAEDKYSSEPEKAHPFAEFIPYHSSAMSHSHASKHLL